MIPFLAPLALKLSPIGRFLKNIPWQIWVVIAVVLLAGIGGCVHLRNDRAAVKAAYAQGKKDEGERIAAKAFEIKSKADAAANKINQVLKEKHDEQVRAIAGSADSLRVRGPGKAACPGTAGIPGGASRPVAAGGGTVPAPTGLPEPDRIAVPFGWLVDSAERCDLNRAEVLSWREWHRQQTEAWARIGG